MEKHVVVDWPLLIPAGTELKLGEHDMKIRAHLLKNLDGGIVEARKPFQLKIGIELEIDKSLFRNSKKGVVVARLNKNVETEQPINDDTGKRETKRKRNFEENLSRGLSNKTAVRGGQ